jgi:hypothetical protein
MSFILERFFTETDLSVFSCSAHEFALAVGWRSDAIAGAEPTARRNRTNVFGPTHRLIRFRSPTCQRGHGRARVPSRIDHEPTWQRPPMGLDAAWRLHWTEAAARKGVNIGAESRAVAAE